VTRFRDLRLEATLLVTHLVGYLGVVFLVLSPLKAVLFILVHQGLMGVYLGCSFAPDHKGMPILGKTSDWTTCASRYSPPATSSAAAGWTA
jgi:hypothetical protein